jgi:hypothetical protein
MAKTGPKKAKAAKVAAQAAATVATVTVRQYHCRCYKLGDEYEMWVLDPATGTYSGPVPCTREQCRACNTSAAEIV